VGKTEGKRPLGRPRRRYVDNIRMDLQEVGCGYMDWIVTKLGSQFRNSTIHLFSWRPDDDLLTGRNM